MGQKVRSRPRDCGPRRIVCVLIDAKPNPALTEAQRAAVRFLRYNVGMPCAECGRRRRLLWTMLMSFKALSAPHHQPTDSGKVHMPLTGVCTSHLLNRDALDVLQKQYYGLV